MREIEIRGGRPEDLEVDLVAVPLSRNEEPAGAIETVDRWWEGALSRLAGDPSYRGEEGEVRFLAIGVQGRPDLLAVGTGQPGLAPEETVRRAAGVTIRVARGHRARSVAFVMPDGSSPSIWQGAAEGLSLGDWSYDDLRSEEQRRKQAPRPERTLLYHPAAPDDASPDAIPSGAAGEDGIATGVATGRMLSDVQNRIREIVTLPGNVLTPCRLAEEAERTAERWGLTATIHGPESLRELGFGALLAVARGSQEEPRFIVLEHAGDGGSPYLLVGKGVTFDSGGISLKPAKGMEAMKYDMSGAAAVLGALEAAARLRLPRRVIGLIPATENLPSGTALKPGDVIKGRSGRSIEVVNTDAEGRLILSDALSFAHEMEPRAIVDVATLTGACVVALGTHAIGMMTTDDDLARALSEAGERCGERVWRLPLWREYRRQIDSRIADLKNSGGREAGTITAAYFLREFVGDVPWAHLDIAGTAWAEEERGYQSKGATGVGVRLLVQWLRSAV